MKAHTVSCLPLFALTPFEPYTHLSECRQELAHHWHLKGDVRTNHLPLWVDGQGSLLGCGKVLGQLGARDVDSKVEKVQVGLAGGYCVTGVSTLAFCCQSTQTHTLLNLLAQLEAIHTVGVVCMQVAHQQLGVVGCPRPATVLAWPTTAVEPKDH